MVPNPFADMFPEAIYIHVPFCQSKCAYCDFYSFPPRAGQLQSYTLALSEEIARTMKFWPSAGPQPRPITSVYFGGGTPSLLSPANLTQIFSTLRANFSFSPDCEITLEANPARDLSAMFPAYRELGINRLSLGLQSTDDDLLRYLGRRHSFLDFCHNLEAARESGFDNISADLIFALPGQSLAAWRQTVRTVLSFDLPHLSFYSLQLEAGTPLAAALHKEPDLLPSAETERAMYHGLRQMIAAHGLLPYELSNAAREGYRARHNSLYWQAKPYFAFGPGASSYFLGYRRSNTTDFTHWLRLFARDAPCVPEIFEPRSLSPPSLYAETEFIDGPEAQKEYLLLAFRLREGPSASEFQALFGESWELRFGTTLRSLRAQGLIEANGDGYRLSRQGLDFANVVFRAFL